MRVERTSQADKYKYQPNIVLPPEQDWVKNNDSQDLRKSQSWALDLDFREPRERTPRSSELALLPRRERFENKLERVPALKSPQSLSDTGAEVPYTRRREGREGVDMKREPREVREAREVREIRERREAKENKYERDSFRCVSRTGLEQAGDQGRQKRTGPRAEGDWGNERTGAQILQEIRSKRKGQAQGQRERNKPSRGADKENRPVQDYRSKYRLMSGAHEEFELNFASKYDQPQPQRTMAISESRSKYHYQYSFRSIVKSINKAEEELSEPKDGTRGYLASKKLREQAPRTKHLEVQEPKELPRRFGSSSNLAESKPTADTRVRRFDRVPLTPKEEERRGKKEEPMPYAYPRSFMRASDILQ